MSTDHDAATDSFTFDAECFFITPIGDADTDVRKRADGVRDAVVKPSAAELGLTTVRADEIEEGGHITLQVLEHCTGARAAVADLTGGNLNVYYEVGIRHALRRPVVLIADEAERGKLPFDLLQQRTVFYTNDFTGAAECRQKVTEQLRAAVGGHVDSPIQAAANLRAFQEGNAVERALAELVTKVEDLPAQLGALAGMRRVPEALPAGAIRDLADGFIQVVQAAELDADGKLLEQALTTLARPIRYITGADPGLSPVAKRIVDESQAELAARVADDVLRGRWPSPSGAPPQAAAPPGANAEVTSSLSEDAAQDADATNTAA